MIRGMGFLLGVCLTVALFVLLLNGADRPAAEQPATRLAIGSTAEPSGASPRATGPRTADRVPGDEAAPDAAQQVDREAVSADAADAPADAPAEPREPWFERPPGTMPPAGGLPDATGAARYLFWSPFRSEWAAQGFATRLTSATAVPVLVVEEGRGKYRVGFDYQDETQRLARVARIETITGLELE